MLFHTFDELRNFEHRLRCHLAQWLRDHESGATAKVRAPSPLPSPSSPSSGTGIESPLPEPDSMVRGEPSPVLDKAKRLADEGRLTLAEALFAKAVARGDDPNAFNCYGLFLCRIGRLAQAQACFERVLELSTADEAWQTIAYCNLGNIHLTRGDLDASEAMYKKSLAIDEKLGNLEGIAIQYSNLGVVNKTRGDLDAAEAMYKKSLGIEEKLGKLEGMAADYGNIGNVYLARGDLDVAEAWHKKSLAINEKLGLLEGTGNAYGNLGSVYAQRGDLFTARDHWTKARDLYAKIGMPHMVEKVRSWLDSLPPAAASPSAP